MKRYLKLMHVHHYIKNFLVFAALACSGQLFDPKKADGRNGRFCGILYGLLCGLYCQ